MQIEDFKRGHWIVIGALMGLALGYAWSSMGSNLEGIRTVDSRDFERDVLLKDEASGLPFVTSIVVHPAEESFDGKVNVVTYKKLAKDKQGRVGWLDKRLIAKIPYKPVMVGRVAPAENLTIDTYLTELAKQSPDVDFHYGWWLESRNAMMLGAAVGIALVGGLWPTLLNVMIGAGFGRKPDPNEPKTKKQKFDWGSLLRKSKSAPKPASPAAHVTVGDQQHLREVADAYERTLGGSAGSAGTATATAEMTHTEAPVRKLEGGPVEAAKPIAKPEDDDEIEVKGEYYPVLIHHHKKKDDDGHHDPGASSHPPAGPSAKP